MTEWVIVADSNPLIGLARIGQLEILHKLASRVVVPPAVQAEVTVQRGEAPSAEAIRIMTQVVRRPNFRRPLVLIRQGELR
jgi:predicted nucleic acid-binding protein